MKKIFKVIRKVSDLITGIISVKREVCECVELRNLKKGEKFKIAGRVLVKHVFDRAVNKYVCSNDSDIKMIDGKTLVCPCAK